MHKTEAGEKKKALTRNAWELAGDAKALQKAAKHLPAVRKLAQRLQEEADAALAEAEAPKAPGQARRSHSVGDGRRPMKQKKALRRMSIGWPHGVRTERHAMFT